LDPFVDFSSAAQQAFYLYTILPDKIDSMGGVWLGKDFSGIGDILDIYNITDKREVFDYLVYMIQIARESYAQERERQSKLKS
jgi:hypothetical protein